MALNPSSPSLTQMCRSQALACVRKYVQVMCALASNILAIPSNETTIAFCLLYPFAKVDFLTFVNDFYLETKVTLDQETFISILARSTHLSFCNPSGILVYELLQDFFIPNDYANRFYIFFEVCEHIICDHVPPSISCLLVTSRLLTLDNQIDNI